MVRRKDGKEGKKEVNVELRNEDWLYGIFANINRKIYVTH